MSHKAEKIEAAIDENVSELLDKKVTDIFENKLSKLKGANKQLRRKAIKGAHAVKQEVEAHPFKTAGLAALVGAAAGLIIGRMSK